MILQALYEYYETLAAQNKAAREGWAQVKVSYALVLNEAGELLRVMPLLEEEQRGKKMVKVPRLFQVPQPVKRTAGIDANFLCDNSSYFLGIDDKGKQQRSIQCFEACRELHVRLLAGGDSAASRAICAYFERWDPRQAKSHPALLDDLEEILKGGNLVFRIAGRFAQEDESCMSAWDEARQSKESSFAGRCLVTGKRGEIARIHSSIKGVRGAQSSGAALVSFNTDSVESFGKSQSYNAPVSEKAVFAYTTALNGLLADREHVLHLGGTTVIYWAQSGEPVYSDMMAQAFGASEYFEENDFNAAMQALSSYRSYEIDQMTLRPGMRFYVLGISPNAARLSVRFFYQNEFGSFLKNIRAHEERLEMTAPAFIQKKRLPPNALLFETVNKNSRDKEATPLLEGALLRSILENTPYPRALLAGVMLRIRAEQNVTYGRAAIIKAYYLALAEKHQIDSNMKEVLTVELNEQTAYQPYVLGRLFSVLEAVQQAANPTINATIRDKYFNSAAATPATIFPILMRLSNAHLRKLEKPMRIYYERQITELSGKITQVPPSRTGLSDQEIFFLGYYHQNQKRYEKKQEAAQEQLA